MIKEVILAMSFIAVTFNSTAGDLPICKDLKSGKSTKYKRDIGTDKVLKTVTSASSNDYLRFIIKDVGYDKNDGMVTVGSKNFKCKSGANYVILLKTDNKEFLEYDRGTGIKMQFDPKSYTISVYENFLFDGRYIVRFRHESFGTSMF